METFYTIQGEGFHAGTPAYFIRLGGCNVGCTWCDVKESWEADQHPLITVKQLVKDAKKSGTQIVVITGGEPAMYDLTELTQELKQKGLLVHIETSGVYPLTGEFDWVTFSPKKFKPPHPSIYKEADELKAIVYHKSDPEWALKHSFEVKPSCLLFLQPEWTKREEMIKVILDFVRTHTSWRISVQTHKYLGVD
ncbi:MAG: 7-carboxy-7-deazaguanine synthase QueE [Flavobacteriales bacterium]|nr:7-carboxy-7-deazaguanine synthase QueE [Flavobacteriales bacterium]